MARYIEIPKDADAKRKSWRTLSPFRQNRCDASWDVDDNDNDELSIDFVVQAVRIFFRKWKLWSRETRLYGERWRVFGANGPVRRLLVAKSMHAVVVSLRSFIRWFNHLRTQINIKLRGKKKSYFNDYMYKMLIMQVFRKIL